MFEFHIGPGFEAVIDWINVTFDGVFDVISNIIDGLMEGIEWVLLLPPSLVLIALIVIGVYFLAGLKLSIFTGIGFAIIDMFQLWELTMATAALVFTSALIALLIGIPLGILAARSNTANKILKPLLDFMQTMPAFVYLIPAVLFFGMGPVPGVVATIIFAMPPVVRLTNLGIRQVPTEVIEAGKSFGSTKRQMLFEIQLPLALPTIMTGVNQTIMLSLSMVVISSMIGAEGLGLQVLNGITQLKIGEGFEAGLAVVILAMVLDRVTQALSTRKKQAEV